MRKITLKISKVDAEEVLEYLQATTDRGPEGAGWRSPELWGLIDRFENAVNQAFPAPSQKEHGKNKRHWYKMYIGECPVCGANKSYRVRIYGRKPRSVAKRYVQLSNQETYDWCDVLL